CGRLLKTKRAARHEARRACHSPRAISVIHRGRNAARASESTARPTFAVEPCRPPWCDQIPTPAENQLYPYSEHTRAHPRSQRSGKLLVIEGVRSTENR